ncbi:hypothetical protein ACTI_00300 [Actinoplanes sp. OR16]|nr:hypothetical protein ACTI_00300 [Actinoplanes sp. OR16]
MIVGQPRDATIRAGRAVRMLVLRRSAATARQAVAASSPWACSGELTRRPASVSGAPMPTDVPAPLLPLAFSVPLAVELAFKQRSAVHRVGENASMLDLSS